MSHTQDMVLYTNLKEETAVRGGNHSSCAGKMWERKQNEATLMSTVFVTSVTKLSLCHMHVLHICVLWITWFMVISHFSFFSNSFVRFSSNLMVASLVDACSFFISASSSCIYRVHR